MNIKNYPAGFDVQAAYEHYGREWDTATISNDKFFELIMKQEEYCLELLRRALPELEIVDIKLNVTQKTALFGVKQRSVRYDLYVKDQEGRIINVEMQVANQLDLPFRIRFYQALLEYGLLRPREPFLHLKNKPTYVIFFCAFDFYGMGKSVYRFENYDRELNLPMGDQRSVIVFNALATDFSRNDKVRTFLDLMLGRVDTKDKYIVDLDKQVKLLQADEKLKEEYVMSHVDYDSQLYETEEKLYVANEKLDAANERADKVQRNDSLGFIKELLNLGLSEDQVITSLMNSVGISREKAQSFYREATTA